MDEILKETNNIQAYQNDSIIQLTHAYFVCTSITSDSINYQGESNDKSTRAKAKQHIFKRGNKKKNAHVKAHTVHNAHQRLI